MKNLRVFLKRALSPLISASAINGMFKNAYIWECFEVFGEVSDR